MGICIDTAKGRSFSNAESGLVPVVPLAVLRSTRVCCKYLIDFFLHPFRRYFPDQSALVPPKRRSFRASPPFFLKSSPRDGDPVPLDICIPRLKVELGPCGNMSAPSPQSPRLPEDSTVTLRTVIAVGTVLPAVAAIAVGLRFYVRSAKTKSVGLDDCLILFALVMLE